MSPRKILIRQLASIQKAKNRCDREWRKAKTHKKREMLQCACEALAFSAVTIEVQLDSLLPNSSNGQISNSN